MLVQAHNHQMNRDGESSDDQAQDDGDRAHSDSQIANPDPVVFVDTLPACLSLTLSG